MEKLLILGDTHGLDTWKTITEKEECDKVIFIGDYFDSFHVSESDQVENFKGILDFKRSNPENVILLIGNHDLHYIKEIESKCSGYNVAIKAQIEDILTDCLNNREIIACYKSGKFLFTHAGVTQTWCEDNKIDTKDIDKNLNDLLVSDPSAFNFAQPRSTRFSVYGDDIYQSPVWVREGSLLRDGLKGFIHIVGHTKGLNIRHLHGIDIEILIIDALEQGCYLMLIDGEIVKKKL